MNQQQQRSLEDAARKVRDFVKAGRKRAQEKAEEFREKRDLMKTSLERGLVLPNEHDEAKKKALKETANMFWGFDRRVGADLELKKKSILAITDLPYSEMDFLR